MKRIFFSLLMISFLFLSVLFRPLPASALCPLSISQQNGSLQYGFNNQWKHYVSFKAPFTGKVDLINIKVGNWGNAWRSVTCKVTNSTGTKNLSPAKSSIVFKSDVGATWKGMDFSSSPIALEAGKNYRLYCKGPDSWNSLYWIYNKQTNPNSKTFEIFMCKTP